MWSHRNQRFLGLVLAGLLGPASVLLAADVKTGVGLDKISLPSGPGSIEGLGDAFEPQLNTGTSAYSVKIAIPPGVNGLQPDVVLRYNAGNGNGHFGIGWTYGAMSIQRQVEKGLPSYGPSDVFTFQGEELVPLSDGSYRMENESAFMRIRREGEGWEIRDKAGTRYRLGITAASRVTRPSGANFADTFKWYVEEVVDVHGNRIEYRYTTFPDSPGEPYCSEIRYSVFGANYHAVAFDYEPRPDAFASFLSGFEIRGGRRCFQVRVESQGQLIRRYGFSYTAEPGDPVEIIAPGDAGLNFSLLRKVTQFDNRQDEAGSFLPPLRLGYTRMDVSSAISGRVFNNPPYSIGTPGMAFADINCDGLPDLFYTDPFTGLHQVFYNLGGGHFAEATDFTAFPALVRLDSGNVQLADFDGDGRIDLVQKFGGPFDHFVFFPNTTQPYGNDDARPFWGPETSFQTPFPAFDLDDPSVRSLDLDNDKLIDFMRTTPFGFVYYLNRTNRWEERGIFLFGEPEMGDLTAADDVGFTRTGIGGIEVPNEQVKLADMNGDRLLDLVRIHTFGTSLEITYWPNKGMGAWGNRVQMQGEIDLGVVPIEDVFIRDVNGDGLADVVAVAFNHISFWINQGGDCFSGEFRWNDSPVYIRGETILQQVDINGNGSTDFLWENFDPATGSYKIEYLDFIGAIKPNLLKVVDNGIGLQTQIEYKSSTEYYVAAREAGRPWQTRLPFASWCVSKITKRVGVDLDAAPGPDIYVTELSYSDGYYDPFEKEFRGFAFAKKVELGDDRPALDLQPSDIHSPSTVTRFAFHTGVPDGIDNDGNNQIDELRGPSGYEEEPLKGRPLWTEVTLWTADFGGGYPAQMDGQPADDTVVFTREINQWQIKRIHDPENGFSYVDAFGLTQPAYSLPHTTTDGKTVSFVFLGSKTVELVEANGTLAAADPLVPVRGKKQLYTETEVDFFGNPIVERIYGEHSPGSPYDDERFSYRSYAFNLDDWLVSLPARTLTTDENGQFVAESRNYYDGAPFTGLPLGQVGTRGLMHREERLVNGPALPPAFGTISKAVGDPRFPANYAINTTRAQYDAFGNVTVVRDPLHAGPGAGHEKEYTYDPVFHTYVEQEAIRIGNGSADLVASATYDRGAGVMAGFTDFNNNSTSFQYDSFWRLVGIIKPGDTAQFPTAQFGYKPGDPFRGLYYNYDATGNLSLVNTADPDVVNAVTTHQREVAGAAGVFTTISFTDGVGHRLGTLHENDVAGQWVAKDFKRYSSRGTERKSFLPFVTATTAYQVPPEANQNVANFYDAAGRVLSTLNPPETSAPDSPRTQTRTVYLPLETILFDEEDINPASPYYNTPHVQLKDGLDRLIGVIEVTWLDDNGYPRPLDGRGAGGEGPSQWLTSYAYDLNDNLTHITDSQANQKWFRYDGLKRKLFMNDPDRGTMTYTYDDAANLTSTLDAKAQAITYAYDGVNRLKSEKYHDGLPLPPWRSLAPIGGEGQGEGETQSVIYHYDTPLANVPIGDGSTATARNVKGMLAYVQDLSGEEHTSYDARGRVEYVIKRLTDPLFLSLSASGGEGRGAVALVSYQTAFAYDSLDRVTTLTYPDSDQVGYQYNARNLLSRITGGPSGSIISSIAYRASDQLRQIDYGNSVRTTYDYDPRLRLKNLLTLAPSGGEDPGEGAHLLNFSYEFDGVSNIKAIRDQRPGAAVPGGDQRRNTQIFQYDDLYRITRAQYSFALPGAADANNGFITYRYDRIGNMLNQSSDIVHNDRGVSVTDLGTMSYGGPSGRTGRIGRTTAAPGPHALTAVSAGNRAFPYDANGNMTVIDGMTNTWDFKDRLIGVESAEMRAEYTYDYTDRRVMKRVSKKNSLSAPGGEGRGEVESVLYPDKYFEVREHDAPVKYVWNGNTRVARVTGSLTTNLRTQRLRVFAGYNLISLAVTATNAVQQLAASGSLSALGEEGQGQVVRSARRWNPPTFTWVNVSPTDTLPAGTVLWLDLTTNASLTLTGTYIEPVTQTLQPGVNFVAGWGLEPIQLAEAIPGSTSAWKYDAPARQWRQRLPGDLQGFSDAPTMLAPGDAVFARPEVVNTLTVPESALQVRYYHQDHLGSSSVLTDAAGTLVSETANYAFGFGRIEFLPRHLREPYQFTQKEHDAESSLSYFETRFLATSLGRFARVDALKGFVPEAALKSPQGLNVYAYSCNRPLVLVDPMGLDERNVVDIDAESASVGLHVVGGRKNTYGAEIYAGATVYIESDGVIGCLEAGVNVDFGYQFSQETQACSGPTGSEFSVKTAVGRGNIGGEIDVGTQGVQATGSVELLNAKRRVENPSSRRNANRKTSTSEATVNLDFSLVEHQGDTMLNVTFKGTYSLRVPTSTPGVFIRVTLQGAGTAKINVSEAMRQYAPKEPEGSRESPSFRSPHYY